MPALLRTSSRRERKAPSISFSEQDGTHFLNSDSEKYLLIVYRFLKVTTCIIFVLVQNLPNYSTIKVILVPWVSCLDFTLIIIDYNRAHTMKVIMLRLSPILHYVQSYFVKYINYTPSYSMPLGNTCPYWLV